MLEEGLAGAIAFLVIYGVYFLATKVEENTERDDVMWHVYTALKSSFFGAVASLMIMPFFLAVLSGIGLFGTISPQSVGPYLIGGFFVCTAWFYRLEYNGRGLF